MSHESWGASRRFLLSWGRERGKNCYCCVRDALFGASEHFTRLVSLMLFVREEKVRSIAAAAVALLSSGH